MPACGEIAAQQSREFHIGGAGLGLQAGTGPMKGRWSVSSVHDKLERVRKLRQWLFAAEDMTINFDIELTGEQPPAQPPLAQRVPAPVVARAAAPAPGRITADIGARHPSALQQVGEWTAAHKQEILVGAIVVASVGLAVATLGASGFIELAGAALARQIAVSGARQVAVGALATAAAR